MISYTVSYKMSYKNKKEGGSMSQPSFYNFKMAILL